MAIRGGLAVSVRGRASSSTPWSQLAATFSRRRRWTGYSRTTTKTRVGLRKFPAAGFSLPLRFCVGIWRAGARRFPFSRATYQTRPSSSRWKVPVEIRRVGSAARTCPVSSDARPGRGPAQVPPPAGGGRRVHQGAPATGRGGFLSEQPGDHGSRRRRSLEGDRFGLDAARRWQVARIAARACNTERPLVARPGENSGRCVPTPGGLDSPAWGSGEEGQRERCCGQPGADNASATALRPTAVQDPPRPTSPARGAILEPSRSAVVERAPPGRRSAGSQRGPGQCPEARGGRRRRGARRSSWPWGSAGGTGSPASRSADPVATAAQPRRVALPLAAWRQRAAEPGGGSPAVPGRSSPKLSDVSLVRRGQADPTLRPRSRRRRPRSAAVR